MNNTYAPYPALAVANYFIKNGQNITPLKLQKLVYFAHGWYLAYENKPLVREPVERWEYGPVIRIVYDNFKKYGNQVIRELAIDWDFDEGQLVRSYINNDDEFTIGLLDSIIEIYGKFTAVQLSNATHAENTPWDIVNRENGDIIDNERIKEHFKEKVEPIRSE